jgi:hypothetical protein
VGYTVLTSTSKFDNIPIRVAKAGNIVSVSAPYISSYTKTESEYQTFCVLPEGFRPPVKIDIITLAQSDKQINIVVSTTGYVAIGVFGEIGLNIAIRVNFSFSQ